jgi:hypothetical protein
VINLTGEQKDHVGGARVAPQRAGGDGEAQAEKSPGLAAGALSRSEERAAQNTKE